MDRRTGGGLNTSSNKFKLNLLLTDTQLTHIVNINEKDQSSA